MAPMTCSRWWSRDLLVSFASGFANSTVASPIPGKTYGTMTSAQWSSSAAKLFAGVQPSKPYYNPWGAAVFSTFGNSRIYGFQYSDYFNSVTSPLGNPLLLVQPSIPMPARDPERGLKRGGIAARAEISLPLTDRRRFFLPPPPCGP